MRVLPADPLGPVGDQQSLAPTPLTPEQQANYYSQGGDDSQYRGLDPKVMGYSSGSVAPYRMIVRTPDNRAVVIEQGQTLDLKTIQAAPTAGDWGAWFTDSPNPYKSYRGQPDALARMAEQQYEQQFGLPAGGADTWRGRIAQYMGGNAGYGAVGGAIGGGIAGLVAGGPVGALIGAVGGAALGGGLGAYTDPNNAVYQSSERIAASLGLAEAKDEFDRSVFGALSIFAVPAQWTEQVLGVGSQALQDPTGTASNISAAWEAARLYYESDPTASLRPGSLTYVDTDMPDITGGVSALVEARRRIAEHPEQTEYIIAEMTGRYGVFGQLRDLVVQSALDPSNVIAGAGANRAARTLARVAGATEVLDDAGRVVGYAGRGATLARAADMVQPRGVFQTLAGSGGLKDIAEAYKNLKVMETFRPGFEAARDLNWFQRALIGTDLMQVYSGTYTKPKWYEVFRLTPDALAHDRVVQANNIMQAMITGRIPLDENFPVRANEIVTQLRTATGAAAEGADEVTRVMASLEGSVLRRALAEGGDVSGDLLKAWRDTRADAAILADMQAKLNMTQGEVLAAAERGWNELLGRYTQAGGVVPEGVNPKVVGATFDLFRKGEVPVSLEEYRAGLMSALTEQAGQWAVKTFQVQPPSLITRLANLNKAAQSTVLLGANPSYPINNVTNNELTMVARGILALRSVDDLVGSLDNLGLSPIRMGEGVITGDLVGEVQGAIKRWGEQAADAGFEPLRQAATQDGVLERVQRGVSRVGRAMPFMALSQKAEAAYSVRAFGSAALDAWSRTWRAGVGFSKLPDSLASTLRTIDPRLPRAIEAAVEAGTHPRDLLDRVFSRLGEVTSGTYMDAAAQRAGLTTEQMQRALSIGNMEQTLNGRLAALPEATPEAVRRVFNDVRVEAEGHLSELIANQAKVEYDAAAHFAGDNEGGWVDGGAVSMLMDNMRARQTEAYIEHSKILENIWEEYHRQAIDTDTFKFRLREAGNTLYNQGLFPLMQANIDGIASAFGKAGSPLPEGFTQLQRSIAMLTEDFHAQKQAALDEFFALPDKQRTSAAWAETNRIIDGLYDNLTGHVHERQALMDEYVAAAYEARFPGSGDPVREWRDLIRAHEAQYQEAVREQFEQTRQLFSWERSQAWREFHARMIRYRTAWLEAEKDARRAAMQFVPGRAALEAEARKLRRPLPVVNQPEVKVPTMAGVSRDDFLKVPRQQMPPEISEAIKTAAATMLRDASEGLPGYRQFVIAEEGGPPRVFGVGSEYPDWYRRLAKNNLLADEPKASRQSILNGLKRIIDDAGKDVDRGNQRIIGKIKNEIIAYLATTEKTSGRPPEPEILRWLGEPEEKIQAAIEAWRAIGQEPMIPQYVAGEPMLTQAQVDMLSSNLRVLEARENMAAGASEPRTYIVQMVDEAGVAEVVDDTGRVFEVRTDEPDVEPMLPPGYLAEDGGLPMPIASAQAEMYHQHVRPALEALQTETMAGVERGVMSLADNVPEAVQEQIRSYLRAAGDRMGEAKLFATRWGEYKRDTALLNYSRRYMADTYLGAVAPYQFWATHSMLAWAAETIQRPALLASYYRTRKFLHASVTRRGTPSRLSGRVKFELPFMPEWMGGGVWVDPLNLGLPLEKFGNPWEQVAQSQSRLQDRTEDVLTEMLNAGEITREQYRQAMDYRPGGGDDLSGALVQAVGVGMPDAYTEARRRVLAEDPTLRNDVADLAVALFPPSLLLYNAYQTLRGTPERISPLPITRDVRNVTAALGMNNGAGINLEAGVRRALNLPTFDQWGDYRVDRELANMAAEGIITAEQARAAMLERSGQAYEMATAREAQQGGANGMVQIFGRLFGGAAVFPEGEMRGRQMQLLLAAAREAQDNGDTGALSEFFETYPEVEARLALMDDPDERLTSFLTDQVWAAWRGLPTLYRRQVQQQLGADFSESFLNRQYDGIDQDTLATWARTLGRYVPGNIAGDPTELDLAPEPVAYEVQRYYDERAGTWNMEALGPVQGAYFDIPSHERVGLGPVPESVDRFYSQRDDLYPGIGDLMAAYSALPKNSEPAAREQAFPGIGWLLDQYYALPKGTGQRSDFLDANPQVKAYWDWKDQYKAANPQDAARANFRAANPQLEAYWNWSDQYKAQNPDAAAYMDSDAPRVRDVYLDDHPELVQYWDWRRAWMEAHPEAEAWIKETGQASTGGEDEAGAPAASGEIVGSEAVKGVVEAYLFSGRSLSYAARQAIQPAFEQYGRDGQTLEQYLLEVWHGGGYLEVAR